MCHQAKHAKIFHEVEKIMVGYICNWQQIMCMALIWFCIARVSQGRGSKITFWKFHKMCEKCVILNVTFLHLFGMFCDLWLNFETSRISSVRKPWGLNSAILSTKFLLNATLAWMPNIEQAIKTLWHVVCVALPVGKWSSHTSPVHCSTVSSPGLSGVQREHTRGYCWFVCSN